MTWTPSRLLRLELQIRVRVKEDKACEAVGPDKVCLWRLCGGAEEQQSVIHVIHAQTGFTPATIGKIRPLPSAKSSGKKINIPQRCLCVRNYL